MASKDESNWAAGYLYDWYRQHQKGYFENLEKAKKMKKRIERLSGKKHIKK